MDVHAPQWGLVEKAMAAAILVFLSPTLGQWVPRVETPLSLPLLSRGHVFKPPDLQKFLGAIIGYPHERKIPELKLTFPSHFLTSQLAWYYIDPSFLSLLFLLPIEPQSKLSKPAQL